MVEEREVGAPNIDLRRGEVDGRIRCIVELNRCAVRIVGPARLRSRAFSCAEGASGALEVSPYLGQGAPLMTCLRRRMIRELELHRKSPSTIAQYVCAVAQSARHDGRSPNAITLEEMRDFVHHPITERKLARSTCNLKLAGIRFSCQQVLGREDFDPRVPAKRSGRLPEPLGRGEVERLIGVSPYATVEQQPRTLAQSMRLLAGIDITRCPRRGDIPRRHRVARKDAKIPENRSIRHSRNRHFLGTDPMRLDRCMAPSGQRKPAQGMMLS